MKKITRTITKHIAEITLYAYDKKDLEVVTDNVYEMNEKESVKHFEKKFKDIGKVVDVTFKDTELIKVSMDVETFVSLATVIPQINDLPDMPTPETKDNE